MRLSRLIQTRKEDILQDFEDFARTHTTPGAHMDVAALRDHAAGILDAFARDLEQPQSEGDRRRKSQGDAAHSPGMATAAEQHGADRAGSGFSLDEMFAEYRALRASVIQHWTETRGGPAGPEMEDLVRFNEAIDQAIAESITRYAAAVSEYRDMFLAVLGHDLRTPLNAILAASDFLTENSRLIERDDRLARSIHRSGKRMSELIDDMLDYTSTQLGRGMPLNAAPADIGEIAREAVEETRTTHPEREIRMEAEGRLVGEWDAGRLRQAISNLLDNAVRHAPNSTVTVSASAPEPNGEVVVAVHNHGAPIPTEERVRIFDAFRRAPSSGNGNAREGKGLGLGLYIASQIVNAHGGRIEVASSIEAGTTFSVYLPRRAS